MGVEVERHEQPKIGTAETSAPQGSQSTARDGREGLGLGILLSKEEHNDRQVIDHHDDASSQATTDNVQRHHDHKPRQQSSTQENVASANGTLASTTSHNVSTIEEPRINANAQSSEVINQSKNLSDESLKTSKTPTEQFIPGYSDVPDVEQPDPEPQSWPKRILNFVRAQWFLITMAILIIIASQKQVPERHEKRKNDLIAYIATSVIFFLTGVTLNTKVLLSQYARWKIHLWVQLQSFLIVSLLMFALVTIAATKENFMDPGLLCGMVLTGTVATTISSNVVMTGQAHGNTALTVTQSTLGNIIGVFLTPALFKAYTSTGAWYTKVLPNEPGGSTALYSRVFRQLGLSVFLPLVVGQVVHNITPDKFIKLVCTTWKVGKLGSVALLIIIWSTYDSAFSSGALHSVPGHNIAFVILMSIIMFLVFLLITFIFSKKWLDRPDTVACCYCIPAKSPAIGIPLSTVLFTGLPPILQAKLQLPLVLYQGLQILAGTILTGPFAAWVDRDDAVTRGRRRTRNPV